MLPQSPAPTNTNTRTPKRPAGWPYEALCRYAISAEYKTNPEFIHTGRLPGAARHPGQRVRHQIDLYWKTENALCSFLIFANAKQHRSRKADLRDIMTLLSVMQEIGAQKGMLITNTGFTSGVLQIAQDRGISLVIIDPLISLDDLPTGTTAEITQELESRAAQQRTPVYQLKIIHKSWTPTPPPISPSPPPPLSHSDSTPPEFGNRQSELGNAPDLSYLLSSPPDDYPTPTHNKSMRPAQTSNKMIQNTPTPTPPTNRPFGLKTK